MANGVVRFYSHQCGFGFITPDDSRDDLFVHQTDIAMDGFRRLIEKQRVSFEVQAGPRGLRAIEVRPLAGGRSRRPTRHREHTRVSQT